MNSSTKERILQFINYLEISKSVFLEKTKIKRGFLDKDKLGGSVSDLFLRKILNAYPSLNIEWLITGKGKMLKSELTTGEMPVPLDNAGRPLQRTIPLYSLSDITGAGHPMYAEGKRPNTITIPHMPMCDVGIYIHGDTMYPILKTGDIACVKIMNSHNDIYWGEMYLLDIYREEGNYFTLKYVQKSELGDQYVALYSHNPDYPPQDVLKEKIHRMGLVKVCIRYNTLL